MQDAVINPFLLNENGQLSANAFTLMMAPKLATRQRSHSTSEENLGSKRKLEDSLEGNPAKKPKDKSPLDALLWEMRELDRLIKGQRNVATDIKKASAKLLLNLSVFHGQRMAEDYAKGSEGQLAIFRQKILKVEKNQCALEELCAEEWPVGVFAATRIGRGLFKEGNSTNSLIVRPGEIATDKNMVNLASKVPSLRVITENL